MQLKRLTLALLLVSGTALADGFPFLPKASLTGTWGDEGVGQADVLIPLAGDNTQLFYGALQGRYSQDDSWSGSLGTGYRRLSNNSLWGGYLYVDRNNTALGARFWDLSPGIERLSETLDLRLTGYLPLGTKRWQSPWQAANTLGIKDYVVFSGHSLQDRLAAYTEEAAKGIEAQATYHVRQMPGLNLTGGLYHYHYQDADNVTGVGARLDYPLTSSLGLILTDSYDKTQGNQFVAGLKLEIGGAKDNGLTRRLTDTINRGLGVANSGALVPTAKAIRISSQSQLIADNIWFFKPAAGQANALADGTFEHPFQGLTQTTVNQAGENAQLFISTGDYGWQDRVFLQSGQHLQGRNDDFTLAANRELPLLHGQMGIDGKQNVSLDNLAFLDQSSNNTPTLTIENADNIQLNHVNIHRTANDILSAIALGINTSKRVSLDDADIEVHATGNDISAQGIISLGSDLNVNNSHFLVQAEGQVNAQALGVGLIDNGNSLTIKNSTISVSANSFNYAQATGAGSINGPASQEQTAQNSSLNTWVNIENSQISSSATAKNMTRADGVVLSALGNGQIHANIDNSSIETKSLADLDSVTNGIVFVANAAHGKSELTVQNTQVAALAQAGRSYDSTGIYAVAMEQNLDLKLHNNHVKAQSLSNLGEGQHNLDLADASGLWIMGRNLNAEISDNTIEVTAKSQFGEAHARGILANEGQGLGQSSADKGQFLIENNVLNVKADSLLWNAFSTGLVLGDIHTTIGKNAFNIEANGKFADSSKAVGIWTNASQDIKGDNTFAIRGFSVHKDIEYVSSYKRKK